MPFTSTLLKNGVLKRVLIYAGFIICQLGALIAGTDINGQYEFRTVMSVIGVLVFGWGAGMICLPIMPEIIEAIESD